MVPEVRSMAPAIKAVEKRVAEADDALHEETNL
jgi:hypothetical protein